MRNLDSIILDDTLPTGTTNTQSVPIKDFYLISFQANMTGGVAGYNCVELSNDDQNWFEMVDDSGNPVTRQTISGPQNALTEVVDVCANYARLKTVISSGSGTIVVYTGFKGTA